ncbi:hypothetical protein Zmor_025367 [Zophobas morio]|uniref:Uncharacterized protein n=1 Tax=Zophobas morio TaxID=2755281 RepID=A0AA38HRG2_9CUCU|nr:hypothetical protein Zmor_025367 [Zophobas morio]
MKCLIFITFLVSALAFIPQQNATLEQYSKPCRDQTGVTPQEIEKGLIGKEIDDDPNLKVLNLCVLKKIDLINDNGNINVEKLKKLARLVAASKRGKIKFKSRTATGQ